MPAQDLPARYAQREAEVRAGTIAPTHIDLNDGTKALVTVHPSYLLRLPDEDAKAREYERFVDDLKIVAAQMKKAARAA